MCSRWVVTVRTLSTSTAAICGLESPRATLVSTSISLAVRSYGSAQGRSAITAPWMAPWKPTPARWTRTSRHWPEESSHSPRRDSSRESMKSPASSAMIGSRSTASEVGHPATARRRPPRSKATAWKPGGRPSGSITHRVRSVTWARALETALITVVVSGGSASRELTCSRPVYRPSVTNSGAVSPERQPYGSRCLR